MAVSSTATDYSGLGTGASATYGTGIYANASDQIKVYANGVLQTLGVNYSLNGIGDGTGVNVVGSFANGATVYIERVTPITQLVNTQNNETILEDVLDAEFDKLTMIAQEADGKLLRALLVPKGETAAEMPSAATRANKVLAFDGSGNPIPVTNHDDAVVAAAGSASAALAAQAAAEAALANTLAAYDSFDDRYLGPKAGDPALDNDGNALVTGAIYYNTSGGGMKVYTGPGTGWVAAYVPGGVYLPIDGSSPMTGPLTGRVPTSTLGSFVLPNANIADAGRPNGSLSVAFNIPRIRLNGTEHQFLTNILDATVSNKTLDSSNVGATAAVGNSSTKLATTAFVGAEIPNRLNAGGSAPMYACRAWVRFNGTGTITIVGSGNVSSITDLGVGTYRVNYTTAILDTGYTVEGCSKVADSSATNGNNTVFHPYSFLTTSVSMTNTDGGTAVDCAIVCLAVHR